MSAGRVALEITLRFGSTERRMSLPELATVFGLNPAIVSGRLTTLLCGYPHPVDKSPVRFGERGTTGGEGRFLSPGTNERTIHTNVSSSSIGGSTRQLTETFVGGDGGCREEEDPVAIAGDDGSSSARIAAYLADRLEDPASIAFYATVARCVPRQVIREALVAALDLSPHEVRRSRAAYFTAIVRPHLTRNAHPHA